MQYVRSISGSVSKTWNSINPATLSGAIDVIVIEQEDGQFPSGPGDMLMHAVADRPNPRNTRMLAVPCPFRQILPPPALREEGRLASLRQQKGCKEMEHLVLTGHSSGRVQRQWGQARLCHEARGRRGSLFRI